MPEDVFEELHPRIREGLTALGMDLPTATQRAAIPTVLSGGHVLLLAPTGTGKTEAVMMPVFNRLLTQPRKCAGIRVLYITPLRALNRDMLHRLKWWGEHLGIGIQVRHGDTSQAERRRQVTHPPDLLITTPETLQVILTMPRMRTNLAPIECVVVDEVHELAGSKRGSQLSVALERLERYCTPQRVGLSATVGSPEEVARFLAGEGREVRVVRADSESPMELVVRAPKPEGGDVELAARLVCSEGMAAQIREISGLVESAEQTLVFVNTRQAAEAFGSRLLLAGVDIAVHHGSLSRTVRVEAEDAFKSGELKALICTSSMELGIDVGRVDQVVQYASPREVSRLVQRVGRSGHREGFTSRGTIIANDTDDLVEGWVISRRALAGEIEPVRFHRGALDVLANQLSALAQERDEYTVDEALALLRRSYVFTGLSRELLERVLSFIADRRLLLCDRDGGAVRRLGRTRFYMNDNLSMIPDEKRYPMRDVTTRRLVASLDEAFLTQFAKPGEVFITRGMMWRIVEWDGEELRVEPVERPSGEVPSWVGQEIPVPFEVAQEVGRLRAAVEVQWRRGRPNAEAWLREEYRAGDDEVELFCDLMARQIEGKHPVPTHQTVVVEGRRENVVVNVCLGTRGNEALGRVITTLLGARFGGGVGLEVDPYRILVRTPKRVPPSMVADLLTGTDPRVVLPVLERSLGGSGLLRWKLFHVARKFGVLDRDADHTAFAYERLLAALEGTPVVDEALRDLLNENIDAGVVEEFYKAVQGGEINIVTCGPTPFGEAGSRGSLDMITPENADRSIILALRRRIDSDSVILFCTNCRKYSFKCRVGDVPERIECPVCDSKMVSALKPWEKEETELVIRGSKTPEERRRIKRVIQNASLVSAHGRRAVVALAARGLGPAAAARVLRRQREEEGFYRDILAEEKKFSRTQRFWE